MKVQQYEGNTLLQSGEMKISKQAYLLNRVDCAYQKVRKQLKQQEIEALKAQREQRIQKKSVDERKENC